MNLIMQKLRDSSRLKELERYGIFGTAPESDYDHIARLTADLFDAPIALVNIVGSDDVWIKAAVGIETQSVPCEIAFCSHTVMSDAPLVVPDLAADPRFSNNPLVIEDPRFRFYAGAPLVTPRGFAIGTLCILDTVPRPALDARQANTLKDLARLVMDRLEQRRLYGLEAVSFKLMEATSDAVVIADGHGTIDLWNAAAEKVFGYQKDEVKGQPVDIILPPAMRSDKRNVIREFLRSRKASLLGRPVELNACRKDGREISVELSLAAWFNDDKQLAGLGAIIRDVTAQRIDAERIAYLAHHDELTGLANRNSLRREIEHSISRAGDEERPFAVVSVDLDRFKVINEALGHRIGDGLLVQVAERLRRISGERDEIARLGGDEFAILRRGAVTRPELARFADAVVRTFAGTFEVEDHLITTSGSIGIATYPANGRDCDTLLNHAELAMYRAKQEGRNEYRFFEADMDGQALEQRALEQDLRRALERGEFELQYQPQFEIATGRLVGAEALLRWRHPKRGYVNPADFIPIAEATGLILPIGEWALRTACRDFARREDNIRLAVNLSPVQFRRSDVVKLVRQALKDSTLPGRRLEIEVTESLLLEKEAGTLAALESLKDMGVTIALDDFGTGYSSLSYLHSFPFDTIKIDRSFVRDAEVNSGCAAILQAIVTLGEALGLTTVAEGIETEEQLAHLRKLGYQVGQGFLLGKPQPLSRFPQGDLDPSTAR